VTDPHYNAGGGYPMEEIYYDTLGAPIFVAAVARGGDPIEN
jgi:hypothetical protein